jgi:UDP-glucose 4-epimerase
MDISNAPMGPRRRATVEIGEEHDRTHLIERVLDDASGRRSAVKVFGTDYPTADSTAVRYYIHVCDLARVTGREDPVRDGLRRAKNPSIFVVDANKSRETMGWAHERSDLATIFADAWRWHDKRFS